MAIPEDDLNELITIISTAIEKASQLNMNTSAYILSMVLVEITEASKAGGEKPRDDSAP